MADASLILDAIVAVSIAAGAFFAVIELRDMKKDRRTQLIVQACTHWTTKEFEEAMGKLSQADARDAKELEKQISRAELYMIADFHWTVARLGLEGLVDLGTLIRIFPFSYVWEKIKPWCLDRRTKLNDPTLFENIEYAAGRVRAYNEARQNRQGS